MFFYEYSVFLTRTSAPSRSACVTAEDSGQVEAAGYLTSLEGVNAVFVLAGEDDHRPAEPGHLLSAQNS